MELGGCMHPRSTKNEVEVIANGIGWMYVPKIDQNKVKVIADGIG